MKSFVLAAGFATLLGGAAFAQTTAAPAETAPAATAPGTTAVGGPFFTVQPNVAGQLPTSHLASNLDDRDVYGANNEDIGEIEDFVISADGTVQAVVIEVGGFLGIGDKDVLVNFDELQFAQDGERVRINAPNLTRDVLTSAPDVDLDALFPDKD